MTMSDRANVLEGIVSERRSVRAFLPTPVPQALIRRVFEIAQQAPSNCNAQPWVVHVVSGDATERVREALTEAARSGNLDPDVPLTDHYIGEYRSRRIGAAVALFEATGVARDDDRARAASFIRNFELFGAPHAALICMPRYFGLREAADCGIYAQTLMLALTAHGLGSCAQGAMSYQMGALRSVLGISDDLACLFGLSFGYPDPAHPSANARTVRASLTETTHFHG